MNEAFLSHIGGELAGGRLVAVVDGKRQYLSDVGDGGHIFMNEVGLRLQNEFESAPVAAAPRTVKKTKSAAAVTDDITIEV